MVVRRTDVLIEANRRRAHGSYYTPDETAQLMAEWLVRAEQTVYGEPSFGDGALIEAVNAQTQKRQFSENKWIACELSAEAASEAVRKASLKPSSIRLGNYLTAAIEKVDAVIANPPYVRLRNLPDRMRIEALDTAKKFLHTSMSPSGSLWMPFLLKMIASLNKQGRIAVILPHDFTYVSYALPLWKHLAENFSTLRVVRTRQRLFPEINQDVIILLADNYGGKTNIIDCCYYENITQMSKSKAFNQSAEAAGTPISVEGLLAGDRVFQKAFIPQEVSSFLAESSSANLIRPLSHYLKFRVGYVSGDNDFFHPTQDIIEKFSLPKAHLFPALIKNKKLRGQGLYSSRFDETAVDNLWIPGDELTSGEKQYVAAGEEKGTSATYKARSRKPWYKVPGAVPPNFLISVFSEKPLFLINDGRHVNPTSMLGANFLELSQEKDLFSLVSSWYSPLTLLNLALTVRTLGGGVFNLMPGEVCNVQILNPLHATNNLASIHENLLKGDTSAAYNVGTKDLISRAGKQNAEAVQTATETLTAWREKK